jgi:hypothetical protein
MKWLLVAACVAFVGCDNNIIRDRIKRDLVLGAEDNETLQLLDENCTIAAAIDLPVAPGAEWDPIMSIEDHDVLRLGDVYSPELVNGVYFVRYRLYPVAPGSTRVETFERWHGHLKAKWAATIEVGEKSLDCR